jgi:hypothetical protein
MTRVTIVVTAVAAAVLGGSSALEGQANPLEQLLTRAEAYERQFVEQFSNVVAEEVYVQETTDPRRKRTLKSDFLFARISGVSGLYVFRDVFEVDGKEVRDAAKAERLMKLFAEPPRDLIRRADEIADEGSRYNLFNIGTINNPLIALAFLQPNYRSHFRFTLARIEKDLGPTIRTVRFEEWQKPTILRTGANEDLPTRGLLWIDETNGRVVKTRLQLGYGRTPPEIVTTFRFDQGLGIDVPGAMEDWYPDGSRGGQVLGAATYGRFRRFAVKTEEAVQTPK